MNWETVKKDFERDGSLRDIYVTPASLKDWQALYPLLRAYPGAEFFIEENRSEPPPNIDETFFVDTRQTKLQLRVGRILIVFHFFTRKEIECDLDPREVTSQTDLDALLAFIKEIGDRTLKTVVITPENLSDHPFISYDPQTGKFCHHKPPE